MMRANELERINKELKETHPDALELAANTLRRIWWKVGGVCMILVWTGMFVAVTTHFILAVAILTVLGIIVALTTWMWLKYHISRIYLGLITCKVGRCAMHAIARNIMAPTSLIKAWKYNKKISKK